jgi:2'-5' RNA ligase
MQQLYFVAIIPDECRQEQVTGLKQRMAEKYGSSHALKSPPHITIIPPFQYDNEKESELVAILDTYTATKKPFSLGINGFGSFPPRVIFLKVEHSDVLNALQRSLQEKFAERMAVWDPHGARPYYPHMTLAFKDLKKSAFHRAWHDLGDQTFGFEFCVQALFLLRHDGTRWRVVHSSPMYGTR